VKNGKAGELFAGFTAAVSPAALTAIRQKARRLNYRNRTELSLQDIASKLNPILRGWIAYYGRFQPSALHPLFRHINKSLVAWAMRKYKRFRASKTRAGLFINEVSQKCPKLFAHWKLGMVGAFA
jgi:RNA-directed DNA polymerase